MSVRASQLTALAALGVPLPGTLTGLHTASGRLHTRPDCAPRTVPFTLDLLEPTGPPWDVTLEACWDCNPDASWLEGLLGAYANFATGRSRLEYTLERAEAELAGAPTPAGLLAASQMLRHARAYVDPALTPDGVCGIAAELTALPPDAAAGAESYLTAAADRYRRLRDRYAATGVLDRMTGGVQVQHPRTAVAGVEHYVAVADPRLSEPRQVVEILLVHSPAVWLGTGWRSQALYRLPGHLAAVLMNHSTELFADGGPVLTGDSDRVLTAAASIFDSADSDAPLADPRTALRIARDLVAG